MKLTNLEKSGFCAIAGLALTTYCNASESKKPAAAKTGTVIVYRAPSPSNGWARVEFNVNHGAPHYLRNGQFEKLELPAGDETISHDNMFASPRDPQIVHVEAGKTVYFQHFLRPLVRV